MSGWKSRYDHEGQSNTDKYMGRLLHVQDNCWTMAKIVYPVYIAALIYVTIKSDLLDFGWVRSWINYLK